MDTNNTPASKSRSWVNPLVNKAIVKRRNVITITIKSAFDKYFFIRILIILLAFIFRSYEKSKFGLVVFKIIGNPHQDGFEIRATWRTVKRRYAAIDRISAFDDSEIAGIFFVFLTEFKFRKLIRYS